MLREIADRAVKWWNVRRGYCSDGRPLPDEVREEAMDHEELTQQMLLGRLLADYWVSLGHPMHADPEGGDRHYDESIAGTDVATEYHRLEQLVEWQHKENVQLQAACREALSHVQELREAWMVGSIREADGSGGTRSNRNVDVEFSLNKALKRCENWIELKLKK